LLGLAWEGSGGTGGGVGVSGGLEGGMEGWGEKSRGGMEKGGLGCQEMELELELELELGLRWTASEDDSAARPTVIGWRMERDSGRCL